LYLPILSTTLALFLPLLVQLGIAGMRINQRVVIGIKKVFYDGAAVLYRAVLSGQALLNMGQTQCQRCNLQVAILKKEPSSPFDATWDIAPTVH